MNSANKQNKEKKVKTNINNNNLNKNEKTVFTKVSEELFEKFRDKKFKNKISSCYDLIVNDTYLNRINEKGSKDLNSKINNFEVRNKEFREKKKAKLQELEEKTAQDINLHCTHTPNGKKVNSDDLRTPEDYLKDHLKYFSTRDSNIQMQRENQIKQTNSELKQSPEISKKSKRLAKKRLKKEISLDNNNTHVRLYNEKLNKLKTHIVKEKDEDIKLTETQKYLKYGKKNKQSINNNKLNKEEVKTLVSKLHEDSESRKKLKEDNSNLKHTYDNDLTTFSSQKLVLETYINQFELNLINLFNKKEEIGLNKEEFKKLLINLGFLKENENSSLFEQAWKITSNNSQLETIESNSVLLFTSSILGLYKGEKEDIDNEKTNNAFKSPKKEKISSPHKIPNRFSTPNEHHRFASSIGTTFGIGHLLNTTGNLKQEDLNNINCFNILKKVLPDFDFEKYSYDIETAKQIRCLFKNWFIHRSEYIAKLKKEIKVNKIANNTNNENFNERVKASKNLRRSADNFRRRIFEEAENNLSMKNDDTSNNENLKSIKSKKLKLEEVYSILKKKKELNLLKQKEEKEKEELRYCTFQPNLGKRNHDVVDTDAIKKLYQHGVEKVRKSKNSQKESKDDFDLCSFKPQINQFNEKIFQENPLVHDKNVKKEVERFEQARLERKIVELQKKKGINNLKQLKNLEDLLKGEENKAWGFDVEKKTFKDTFNNFNKDRSSLNNNNNNLTRSLLNSRESKYFI